MHRPRWSHAWIELDLTKGSLVAGDILLQKSEQCLGLLRAEINSLKVSNLDLAFTLLLECAKGQEKIPDVDTHLHAVGVGFAVVGGITQLDVRLRRNRHRRKCNYFRAGKGSEQGENSLSVSKTSAKQPT